MKLDDVITAILSELAYRSDEGIVDLRKKTHIALLSEILDEYDLGDIKSELITNLVEGNDFKNPILNKSIKYRTKSGEEQENLVGNLLRLKDDDPGKIAALKHLPSDAAEKQKVMNDLGGENQPGRKDSSTDDSNIKGDTDGEEGAPEPETGTAFDGEQGDDYKKNLPDGDPAKKQSKKVDTSNDNITQEDIKVFDRIDKRMENILPILTTEQQKLAKNCYDDTKKLFRSDISKEKKIKLANDIRDKYNISTNEGNTKYYVNKLGIKARKIFGDGSKSSKRLVSELKKYTQLDYLDSSGAKAGLSSAAKPDMGKEFIVTSKNSPKIKQFFDSDPTLSRISEKYRGIYAPLNEDGTPMFPSNQHTKEYLKQSFENPALDKTINEVKRLVDAGLLAKGFDVPLIQHKEKIQNMLDKFDIPSDKLSDAIDESYNELMVGLNKIDDEASSAIMKQLAENRLYESELAKGNEVYLPSAGSFPGGDIIKRSNGKLERVTLVSCKFGKTGRTYGCPANMKAVSQLHPDESKRDILGQFVGEDGYSLMVKDELIKGQTRKESVQKTKKLISDSLLNQKLGNTFDEKEIDEISEIITNYQLKIETTRENLKKKHDGLNANQFWGEFQKELKEFKTEYGNQIQKVVTPEKMENIVGKNNTSQFKSRLTPDVFISTLLLCENIRSSGGYNLEHNKQYYDEFGTPKFVTDRGTNNPDDYALSIRNERTVGRNGGGIQLSYTGDGERPIGEILE